LGFGGPITIVPIAIEAIEPHLPPKEMMPTFLYVGRLAPSKRVEHILKAFAQFRTVVGSGRLWLIGDGVPSYVEKLGSMATGLGVQNQVQFCGRLSTGEKHHRMAQSHMLLMTSVREGWGLVVTEANACGTPAVVYDVAGLRDAVEHLGTGLIVNPNPPALAAAMESLWSDEQLYRRIAQQAAESSKAFSVARMITHVHSVLAQATQAPTRAQDDIA
jgi:glycosyltransferase involved in cell wall biosynthesis